MLYVFHAVDKPDHRHVRRAATDDHVAYLKGATSVELLLAGPLLDTDEETVIGSLIVVDAPDAATVEDFVANDPYSKAGLFATTRIMAFRKTVGWNEPG
jgi:uncharacterized protein YciI